MSDSNKYRQSKMINIPRTINDDFYRYQMPELSLIFKHGSHTIINNLPQVAKSLRCNPMFLLKYFGYSTGVSSSYKNNKYVLSGVQTLPILNKYLDKFIDKYILCHVCGLPEITLSKTQSKIKKDCYACGNKEFITPNNKCETFMYNNL